jgi:hypothetical protein
MKQRLRPAITIAVLLLTACASQGVRHEQAVSAFTLNRNVTIPANQARVIFQHGKASRGKNLFDWHCELEIDTVSASPQRVLADTFIVTGAYSRIVRDEQSGMPLMPFGAFTCGERYYETHFRLHSDKQPGVRKMLCRNGYHFCSNEDFITREEMKEVFGNWVTVR